MVGARWRTITTAGAVLAGTVAGWLVRAALSAWLWAFVFVAGGGALITLGVAEVWGRGYAFLAAGMMLALAGIVLVRGLTRGG